MAGLDNRPGAHEARLEGNVEGALGQANPAQFLFGRKKGFDFGMGGNRKLGLPLVVPPADDFPVQSNDGPDRNLTRFEGFPGLF